MPALPQFTISLDGSFSISVSSSMAMSVATINGFSLPFASFTFTHTASLTAVQNLNASLSIGPLEHRLHDVDQCQRRRNLNSDGTYLLTGTTGAGASLTGLPISSVAAGANVRFDQNALTMTGSSGAGCSPICLASPQISP
jgi:hypothetical protein